MLELGSGRLRLAHEGGFQQSPRQGIESLISTQSGAHQSRVSASVRACVSASLSVEAGLGEAFDELALGEDEDDENRDGGHCRCCHLDVPHGSAVCVGESC